MSDRAPPVDCREAAERLYEYLDRELTPAVEQAVRRHLAECAPCLQLFDFEEGFLRFLQARSRVRGAPAALKRKILDSLLCEPDASEPA